MSKNEPATKSEKKTIEAKKYPTCFGEKEQFRFINQVRMAILYYQLKVFVFGLNKASPVTLAPPILMPDSTSASVKP